MNEQDNENVQPADNGGAAVGVAVSKQPRIAPVMLYEVLSDEYRALGIFGDEDVRKVSERRKALKVELGIMPFPEAEKLPEKVRLEQFRLRQKLYYLLLERVRELFHAASSRKFDSVHAKYLGLFGVGAKADEESIAAAELATLIELESGEVTVADNADAIRTVLRARLENEQAWPAESKKITDQLDELKRTEAANSTTALCLSGGGIRSATFCLGVVQSLANHGLLGKIHYLSSVSGGGYVASWLSAWICRRRIENEKLAKEQGLVIPAEPQKGLDEISVGEVQDALNYHKANLPEPTEITHLRKYSNYMSPIVGFFSTDTWVLIAVYLRNLLLNWTVIIPLIAAILIVPRLFDSWLGMTGTSYGPIALGFSVVAALFGVSCINMMRPSFKDYSPFPQTFRTDDIGSVRSTDKVVACCFVPILLFAFGVTTYWSWRSEPIAEIPLIYFVMFGIVLFVGGYLVAWAVMLPRFILGRGDSAREAGNDADGAVAAMDDEDGPALKIWIWLKDLYKTYFSETILSIICGAFGGALLYLTAVNIFPVEEGFIYGIDKAKFLLCFGVPIVLLVFLLAATLFTGLAVRITDDDDREWVTRFGAMVLKTIAAWTAATSAVIFGPLLFDPRISAYAGGYLHWAVGLIVSLAGVLSSLSGFSSKTPANQEEPAKDWTGFLITVASSIAAPIFVLLMVIVISYGTQRFIGEIIAGSALETWLAGRMSGDLGANVNVLSRYYELILFGLLALIGTLMGFFININKFSIHSTYRERLIRAYLGASNRFRLSSANSFTGLDTESDNLEMRELRQKPLHIVNMALNMVKSDNLAWQNRKAESFTASALHSGSSQMGSSGNYRSSERYGFNKQNDKAITLGTSAAISGAAVSPNMGYFTQSTAVSFLMVLFNVRLGWWLGNPGQRGNRFSTWKKAAPLWSPLAFLSEALGRTDDTHPYVYLADGGQFENLGLYEMVLRRCTTIIVCDAGADPKPSFFDLGSAMHKIRVDMGIPIDFEVTPEKGKYGAIGTIRYSHIDGPNAKDGVLIYLKPTLTGTESIDIQHYSKENTDFPHETTADQFYSETQFESYRSLGFQMMERLCIGPPVKDIAGLITNVRKNLGIKTD